MREIKFRAWDKTYKRMNYKVQVGNTDYADQNYTCNSIWVDYSDNKSEGWMNADEKCIDLMQYTGLKDKNGKEIYEGDIVKASYEIMVHHESDTWGSGEFKNHKGIVRFTNGSFWIEDQCLIGGMDTVEIIGNIYENPELLNPLNKH